MSTELTEKCVPSALPGGVITEERRTKVDALTFNAEQGEPLTLGSFVRVGFPQGANTEWIVPLSTGEVKLKELVGIPCYYAKGGVLWGNKDPRPGSMPVLRTHNLVDAYQLNDDIGELSEAVLAKARREDGSYDWARLEYNRFGSAGKDRKGKRAKEFRSIFLLCEGMAMPLIVRLPASSIKVMNPFLHGLSDRYYRCVISLSLQTAVSSQGIQYPRVVPKQLGVLTPDEGLFIEQNYYGPIKQLWESADSLLQAEILPDETE